MVNYKFESVQMLKSSVSELEVEQKLADIRMQLSEASLEMKSVDAVLNSVTLALDVIHNYKGEDDQIIDLINCGGAMERLLGVAEKDITVSASEEGLGDVLKTVWEKIKQFVAWLIQKIKDFGVWIGKKLGLVKDKNDKILEELKTTDKKQFDETCNNTKVGDIVESGDLVPPDYANHLISVLKIYNHEFDRIADKWKFVTLADVISEIKKSPDRFPPNCDAVIDELCDTLNKMNKKVQIDKLSGDVILDYKRDTAERIIAVGYKHDVVTKILQDANNAYKDSFYKGESKLAKILDNVKSISAAAARTTDLDEKTTYKVLKTCSGLLRMWNKIYHMRMRITAAHFKVMREIETTCEAIFGKQEKSK